VLYVPEWRVYLFTGAVIPAWIFGIFRAMEAKKTYICQAEILAAACAYFTFPDVVRGRLVHHFIDNESALAGLVKGSSGKPDSARVLLDAHVQIAALQCRPWFGFVYSEDNLSDPPSRGDFGLLLRLGARWRDCPFPLLAGASGYLYGGEFDGGAYGTT